MARLYTNENFPMPVVEALRQLGHAVLTVFEAGNANQRVSDEAVLAFATAHGRALVTINRRDFIRLHRQHTAHQGIIVCTEDGDVHGQAQRIDNAIGAVDSLAGVLLRINRPS